MSIDALIKLFDSLIKPVLLYGCQILTPYTQTAKDIATNSLTNENYFKIIRKDTYESFHLRFLKWCLGSHRYSSNIGTWGETGRYPLIINSIKLAIDYFKRVENMPDNFLVKKAYEEQKLQKFDWYKTNTNLLENFDQLKYKRASINVNVSLESQFVQHWTEA